jgi:hypothetical protein
MKRNWIPSLLILATASCTAVKYQSPKFAASRSSARAASLSPASARCPEPWTLRLLCSARSIEVPLANRTRPRFITSSPRLG